jgi:hypothetical protein
MGLLSSIEQLASAVHSGVRNGEARAPLEPVPG